MRHLGHTWVVSLALVALAAAPAAAATTLEAGGLATLGSSGQDVQGGLAGLRFGGLQRGAWSSHLGLSGFAATESGTHLGAAGLFLDLGAGYGAPLAKRGLLVPTVALSAVAAAGEGGGGADLGVMTGVGAVSAPEHGTGIRIDATLRWFPSPSEAVVALTAGLVWR